MYLPWIGTAAALAFAVYVTMRSRRDSNLVNRRVKKEIAKIVDTFDIEDLDKKIIFCRCWRSTKVYYNCFNGLTCLINLTFLVSLL